MIIKINIDKLKSKKSSTYDQRWYKTLLSMIKLTDNKLYSSGKVGNNFYLVSTSKNSPVMLRVPITLIMLEEAPHTSYDSNESEELLFKDVYVDFRFLLLFQNKPDLYKKYFNSYSTGLGIYAPLSDGSYIKITPNSITKAPKSKIKDETNILPDDWRKYVKIIEQD